MSILELRHYANTPVVLDRAREYVQAHPVAPYKPHGFWVSVPGEDDWLNFCRSEEFALDHLVAEHQVALTSDANVLHLRTPTELEAFHVEYSVTASYLGSGYLGSGAERYRPIDWRVVAREYEGIIIAPYQWSMRLDGPFWYYGWDVASGCIWGLDAIESLTLMPLAEAVRS